MVRSVEKHRVDGSLLNIGIEERFSLIIIGQFNRILHKGAIAYALEWRVQIVLVRDVNAVNPLHAGIHQKRVVF